MTCSTSIGLGVYARTICATALAHETGGLVRASFGYDAASPAGWAEALLRPCRAVYESGPTGFRPQALARCPRLALPGRRRYQDAQTLGRPREGRPARCRLPRVHVRRGQHRGVLVPGARAGGKPRPLQAVRASARGTSCGSDTSSRSSCSGRGSSTGEDDVVEGPPRMARRHPPRRGGGALRLRRAQGRRSVPRGEVREGRRRDLCLIASDLRV